MKRLAGALSLALVVTACGGDAATDPGTTGAAAGSQAADTSAATADWTPSIRTASEPDDPCAWIPVADVEAVMGTLAEPPRKEDGCLYTFVLPEAVAAKRRQAKELQEKLAERFGKPDPELTGPGSLFAVQQDPKSYAVSVSVDVRGEVEAEQAFDAMAKSMMGIGANQAQPAAPDAAKAATDWDDVRSLGYGFTGRVGHVRVSVQSKGTDVPREQMRALAERVRDRVPDLPFAVTNPYQIIQLGTVGDPCSLLTRAEVEAVLGPLAVEPYRSSSNWPPLAHGKGFACAYFTPGHHVFVVSPTWSGGKDSFRLEKGIGGLVGSVLPKGELTVMKGPWDAAQVGMTGALQFLKGDILLDVYHRTSRATRGEAIKLAAIAMTRLAP